MQVPSVIGGGGIVVNLAAAVALVYFGVRLWQAIRPPAPPSSVGHAQDLHQLRHDLKEDHADQLQFLAVKLEMTIREVVRQELARG